MSRIEQLRETLGGPHPAAATKVRDHLEPYVQAFIGRSPFAVLASCDADGHCDASPRGGVPGFIRVVDPRTLLIPDIGGNRLFQSYGNFESNPRAGLVFMIPGMDITARVNGRVQVVDRAELDQRFPELAGARQTQFSDANSTLVQGLLLSVEEAYFHCPRSFRFADLWNTDVIAANARLSLKDLA